MFCRKHESQKFYAKKYRSSASFRDDWKAAIDSLVVFTYSMVMYATHLTQNIFCGFRETVYVSDVLSKTHQSSSKHESQKFNAKKCRSSASFRDDWKAA